jgi:hypothetical protein
LEGDDVDDDDDDDEVEDSSIVVFVVLESLELSEIWGSAHETLPHGIGGCLSSSMASLSSQIVLCLFLTNAASSA